MKTQSNSYESPISEEILVKMETNIMSPQIGGGDDPDPHEGNEE